MSLSISHSSSRSSNSGVSETFFNDLEEYPEIDWNEVTTSVKSLVTFIPANHVQGYATKLVTYRAQLVAISTLKEINVVIDPSLEFDFPHYEPKQRSLNSFFLTNDRQIYISSKEIARGGSKKVSNAVHLNTLEKYVKVTVRGSEDDISVMKYDLLLNELFYKVNQQFIKKPSRVEDRIITKTKHGDHKYIIFEPKLKVGSEIPSHNLFQIAHFIFCQANSLESIHKAGYIYCDGKKENFLFSGDQFSTTVPIRAVINDFGLCVKADALVRATTKKFAPPEALLVKDNKLHFKRIQAHVSFDSYQLGLTILNLLFPEIIQETVFGLLSTTQRQACFMKFQAIHKRLPTTTPKEKSEKKFHSNLINIAKKLTTNNPPQRPTIKLVIDHINKFIKEISI